MKLASEARLQAIIESSVEAIITIDDSGIIQMFNPAAEKIFSYKSTEVIGKNINILMPMPYKQEHDSYIKSYQASGDAKIIGIGRELTAVRKDGTDFPIWLSVAEFYEEEKQYFTGFIQDITAFKHAQEALRLREEEFQLIFENAPTGVAVLDTKGHYTNVNTSLCDMLGYSKLELLKLSYKDITHPEDLDISSEYLSKLLKGDFSNFNLDKRYIRKDKKIVNVVLNVAVVHENVSLAHDEKGNPAFLISHILDVSDKVEIENKLKIQQEQLAHRDRVSIMGEMTAGIAHEINQPLTAIESYSQAAQRRIKANDIDKLQELLEKISRASKRAGDVISHLQAMVKRDTQQHEQININRLIEEVVKLAEIDALANEFKIKQELASTLPYVMADVIQLQQVVLNLVRNAMDAAKQESEGNRQITITTLFLADENRIQVSVKDCGKGIDDITAQQLYNPFFTTKKSGMGMGLAICQSIIQSHGGRLWFIHNEKKGTTFHFTLPTAVSENE